MWASLRRSYDLIFNMLFLVVLCLIATGGGFFLQPAILRWAENNPFYHRLAVAAVFLAWTGLWYLRGRLFPSAQPAACQQCLVWLWEKSPVCAAWFLFLGYILVLGTSAHLRHQVFQTSFDMAIFDQALWNTAHGRFLYSSIKGGICILGDHMSPLLLLYVPLYYLWDNAAVILWAQVLIASCSLILLYHLACWRLEDRSLALAFAAAYFFYLPMRNALRFDFHPEVLSDFLWLVAIWALWKRNTLAFVAFCLGACLGKENMWGVLGAMGAYLLFFEKRRVLGAVFMGLSGPVFFLCVKVLVPAIGGGPYRYLGNFSESLAGWHTLFSAGTLLYLAKIFLPLGFLSLLAPGMLVLAVPVLAQNLLSINPATHSIFFQYTYGLTCFVFAGAVEGIARFKAGTCWIQRAFPRSFWGHWTLKRLGVWMIFWSVLLTGVGEGHILGVFWSQKNSAISDLGRALKEIPPDASVLTHQFYAPHLGHRRNIYLRESLEAANLDFYSVDYAVLDERIMGDPGKAVLEGFQKAGYTVIYQRQGVWIYAKIMR